MVYVILIIVILIITLIICYKVRKIEQDDIELKGVAYNSIKKLNRQYQFKTLEFTNGKMKYFRRTNPQKYKDSEAAFNFFVDDVVYPQCEFFEEIVRAVDYNAQLYEKYTAEYNRLSVGAKSRMEEIMCKNIKIEPKLNVEFKLTLFYKYFDTSMSNDFKYDIKDIRKAISVVKVICEAKKKAQYERSLMSDAMRFKVFKRDNYTCQICGVKKGEGVELEVDHIIPISKGGETRMDNLQTLCKRCNRGKGVNFMD